ncbi:Protein of unknown function (DUF4050) domain containing protein [Naviculisporaceae sp. PSN 640]
MATAVNKENEMHRDEVVISTGAPFPISNPSSIPDQQEGGGAQQTSASAASVITSSPPTFSPRVESQFDPVGQTALSKTHHIHQQVGVTSALSNLAGDQSGPSSLINKHHNCCNAAADVISQQQQQPQQEDKPLLQQHAAGFNTCSEPLQTRIPPSSSLSASNHAQRVQVSCVSNCQSEEQACHSGGHDPGPGLLDQHPQQAASHTEGQIIPPQNAQARLTPHKHQELPTPAPPSYINSAGPSQLLGSPQEGTTADPGGKSHAEQEAGGEFNQQAQEQQPHDTTSGLDPQTSTPPTNMIFSDLYKSPRSPFNKLRHSIPAVTLLATDLEADLISRDKTRQKEAVKKFLNEKIRNDWEFTWPPTPAPAPAHADDRLEDGGEAGGTSGGSSSSVPTASPTFDEDAPRDPGEEAESESDAESVYSTVSEDQLHFHPRIEWTSDISDDDLPAHASSPFRFDTPDAVGTAVQTSINERKARRRRAVRDEISWNPGLACFEARRDAWTGAKTVRVKPKPATPISPSSTRRLSMSFWRHHRSESTASQNTAAFSPSSPPISSPLSPTTTHTSNLAQTTTTSEPESSNASKIHSTTSRDSAAHALYPVETLIPVAPPLLPPQNPMRASVTPSIYPSLYDKIVVHSLQPSCPVNLGDMLRACVVGWKRDGEWPPKSTIQAVPMSAAAEAMVLRHQRKASQAQARHARKASTATNGSSRRLSFVGFLGGGNKNAGGEKEKPGTIQQVHEEKEAPNAAAATANGGKDTHSDEANSGGTGKGIRRSLQKVFSFGQHGHHEHAQAQAHGQAASAPAEAPISPTKEVTAAG